MGGGGALNVLSAVCQQACLLAITMLIARVLGQAALGSYVLCYAMLTLLALVTVFGFRPVLIRFLTMYLADDDPGRVLGTLRFVLRVSALGAVVGALVLVVLAGPIASAFDLPEGRFAIICVALALPAFTLRDVALAGTQGWRSQRPFAVIGWVVEPVTRLVLTAAALTGGLGVRGTLASLVIAAWLTAAAALWSLLRRTRTLAAAPRSLDLRPVLSFALASFANVAAATGIVWADTIILGALEDPSAVGVYVVGTRLVGLAIFVMAPLDALFAPQFAHLFHTRETDRLAQMYVVATTWILRLSMPAFVALLAFGERLLRIFGDEFAAGASVTLVLALGQLVNAATGPCGSLLVMAGRVRINLLTNGCGLIGNIALNLLLIPTYGILGSAIAWSVSLVLLNLAKLFAVHRILRMSPVNRGTLRVLFSALSAGAVAVIADQFTPEGIGWTIGLGVVVAVAYLAASALLGLSDDERAVLADVPGLPRPRVRLSSSGTTSSSNEGKSITRKST